MWIFLKRMLVFRLGQSAARTVARGVGLGRFSLLLGLIGGWRAVRRHRHA